jgi:hypothetical protein
MTVLEEDGSLAHLLLSESVRPTDKERPMSRAITVQECDQAIGELLPDLPRPEQKELANLVTGVVLKETIVLSKAAAATPGDASDASKLRRAQRLLANPRLGVPRAQRRVLARILAHCQGSLHLLIDPTTTGATRSQPGTMTLMLALAWHRRAIPILWRTWRTDQKGQHWTRRLTLLFATLARLLPAGVQVTVMTDRGLTGKPLVEAILDQGWHYLLRAKHTATVRLPDGSSTTQGTLAPHPGWQCWRRDAQIWPGRHRQQGPRVPDWEQACRTNLTALWRVGDKEPWFILSDWPPGKRRCIEYRKRTWEEELFRDLKSIGWHWNQSRVRHPRRVERLLLVLTLATLWVLCLAHRVIHTGTRRLIEAPGHRFSRFQLGLRWVARLVGTDQHVPCTFHLKDSYAT